jgi:hypothetical protein
MLQNFKLQSSNAFEQLCVILINFHQDLGSMCMIEILRTGHSTETFKDPSDGGMGWANMNPI